MKHKIYKQFISIILLFCLGSTSIPDVRAQQVLSPLGITEFSTDAIPDGINITGDEIDVTPEQIENFAYILKREFAHKKHRKTGKIHLDILDLGSSSLRVPFMLKKYLETYGFTIKIIGIDETNEHINSQYNDGSVEFQKYSIKDVIDKFGVNSFDVAIWSGFGDDPWPSDTLYFYNVIKDLLRDDGLFFLRDWACQRKAETNKKSLILLRIKRLFKWQFQNIPRDFCQFPRDMDPQGKLRVYDDMTIATKVFNVSQYSAIFMNKRKKSGTSLKRKTYDAGGIKLMKIVAGNSTINTTLCVREDLDNLPEMLYILANSSLKFHEMIIGIIITKPEKGFSRIIPIDYAHYELHWNDLRISPHMYNNVLENLQSRFSGKKEGILKPIYVPWPGLFFEIFDDGKIIIGQGRLDVDNIKKSSTDSQMQALTLSQMNNFKNSIDKSGLSSLSANELLQYSKILNLDINTVIVPRWNRLIRTKKRMFTIVPDLLRQNIELLLLDYDRDIVPIYYYLKEIALINPHTIMEHLDIILYSLNEKIRPRILFLRLMNHTVNVNVVKYDDDIFYSYFKHFEIVNEYTEFLSIYKETEKLLTDTESEIISVTKSLSEDKKNKLFLDFLWLRIYSDARIVWWDNDDKNKRNFATKKIREYIGIMCKYVPRMHRNKMREELNKVRTYGNNMRHINKNYLKLKPGVNDDRAHGIDKSL